MRPNPSRGQEWSYMAYKHTWQWPQQTTPVRSHVLDKQEVEQAHCYISHLGYSAEERSGLKAYHTHIYIYIVYWPILLPPEKRWLLVSRNCSYHRAVSLIATTLLQPPALCNSVSHCAFSCHSRADWRQVDVAWKLGLHSATSRTSKRLLRS